MLSKIQQRLWEMGQSLAGDGMLLRLRNASIALVAAVTAVGLGLTLFISQLGFPAVFSSPIPGNPTKAGSVHDAIALTHRAPPVAPVRLRGARATAAAPEHKRSGVRPASDNGRGSSRQLAVSPGAQSGPATQQPVSSAPASEPAPQPTEPSPSVPSPAPAPVVADSPSKTSSGKGASDGKPTSSAPAVVKATSDGNGGSGGRATAVAKTNYAASEKSGKDQSAASTPKPVAAAPAVPPVKQAPPEAASPAAAKEASDKAESDKSHH